MLDGCRVAGGDAVICRLCLRIIKGRRAYTYLGGSVHKSCRTKARAEYQARANKATRRMLGEWLHDVWMHGSAKIKDIDEDVMATICDLVESRSS